MLSKLGMGKTSSSESWAFLPWGKKKRTTHPRKRLLLPFIMHRNREEVNWGG